MDADTDPAQTVDAFLRMRPRAARVFIRRRMACVGCVMAPFETLDAVVRRYGIEKTAFLAELAETERL